MIIVAKQKESRVDQLKVTLNGVKLPIWRRLLVPSSISLRKLHDILQVALGWVEAQDRARKGKVSEGSAGEEMIHGHHVHRENHRLARGAEPTSACHHL
jgi:hypothetical protein